jgi:hypothetical protein
MQTEKIVKTRGGIRRRETRCEMSRGAKLLVV